MGNTMQEFYYPRDTGLIPESGRSSGVGNDNPFSILAWEIPWTEDFGHYGVQESTFPLHVSGDSIEENPQSLF